MFKQNLSHRQTRRLRRCRIYVHPTCLHPLSHQVVSHRTRTRPRSRRNLSNRSPQRINTSNSSPVFRKNTGDQTCRKSSSRKRLTRGSSQKDRLHQSPRSLEIKKCLLFRRCKIHGLHPPSSRYASVWPSQTMAPIIRGIAHRMRLKPLTRLVEMRTRMRIRTRIRKRMPRRWLRPRHEALYRWDPRVI